MPPFTRDIGFVARLGCTYVDQEGSFTGEAYSIDKATVYGEYRQGDISYLDIAMGDTMGDLSIFQMAKRPIAFNPSFTLAREVGETATMISAGKDLVTVINSDSDGVLQSEQFHCSEAQRVIELVKLAQI
jgi:phosphoserine phosphatase